ncbi:MAG: BTAD domain-containing putative transcriptional regulator, partial [Acidimicrobiales bacterium]
MADIGLDELSQAGLRVQLVGPFQMCTARSTTPLRLPAGKATTVAQLLAVRRGSFVSVDAIVDVLWGDDPPPGAAQNVASLVSRLRKVVGPDPISGGRAGYRLETACTAVDVDDGERLIAEAEAQLRARRPALAASAAAQARAILESGEFLEDEPFADWAEEGRRRLARLVRQARRAVWTAAVALGAHDVALAVATTAVDANPLDEEAQRARMQALHLAGDAGAALAAYESLRTTLVDELGADPSPQTEALYLAILRGEPLPGDDDQPVDAATPSSGDATPLAGRDEELRLLSERWSTAVGGRPGVVVVAGAVGSGKTVVCSELARQARATGAAVLWSTCHEAERSLFLQPVVEGLRAFLGAIAPERVRTVTGEWSATLAQLMPELRRLVAVEHYERATPEIEHRRALEAVAGAVRNIARQQPVLLVLDGVHNAGASTLEAVHFVVDRLSTEPVLVLVAAASDAVDQVTGVLGRDAEVVSLGPLSLAAVERLGHRLGAPDVDASELLARTGGNAQFVVEALRLGGAVPLESLQVTVLERVRQAGRDVEDFLRVGAVLGTTFDLDFAADIASITEEDAAERAERALRAGLLTTAGARFEFAGSVIGDALYETTPAPIRASRHRRAASRLADRPEAAAAHHAAAGDWP